MADVRRLPRPVAQLWEWQLRSARRDLDSVMFFHPEHERGTARAARDRRAKQVCHGCPVIEDGRNHALTVREPYSVWGALTEAERTGLVRSDA